MDFNKAALEMHETHHGKVGIVSKVEVKNRDQLATAYTPGVAEPCRKIKENPDDVYKYTFKGNMVAVVSNGTAVLGLGDIGPKAGLPVMEGKAVLFKEFGGVDAFPICIDAHDAASVIAACKAIAPTFGGINLEDIKSPECFEIEETLERELDIPVFHDDQHGTAIVVTAALINALRVVGKKMEVTFHHRLSRTSAFYHIPLDDTDETFVRIGIHKNTEVHLLAQPAVAQSQNTFDDDDLTGFYMHGFFLARTGKIGIYRLFNGFSLTQHGDMLGEQIPVECRRMVKVDVLPFFHGHMTAVLII